MSKIKQYSRNLLANWVGYGAGLVVMFFLSPFVVHRLGDTEYGVWSLLVSLTGYMGLIELGTRGGLDRFINYYLGQNDTLRVNKIINTGLTFFVLLGLGLFILAAAIAMSFHLLFPKTPVEFLSDARITILLVALNLWLSFLGTPFFQILTAFERFDLLNAINLAVLFVRTALTVLVLFAGQGIVALAVVQAVATVLGNLLAFLASKKIFADLTLGFALASWEHFRQLFTFSMWGFVGNVSMQLLYWTDNVLIAIMLGPEMVTYYSIGGMLVIYCRGLIEQCARIFIPQIIKDIARKDWPSLQSLFLQGSNFIMAVSIFILVAIGVFGREFLALWMGPAYAEKSYNVLLILTISQFPAVAILLGGPVIMGLNKVRLGALLTLFQALANLALSIFFVKYLTQGIDGVAWGTFYPRILFAMAIHYLILLWVDLPVWSFLKNFGLRWMGSALLFTIICLAVSHIMPITTWSVLIFEIGLAILIYLPFAWFALIPQSQRLQMSDLLKNRFGKSAGK
jgi:O-antigen/teichoic acid export membrane protein